MNDKQIADFNEDWDSIILKLTTSSKKIEEELLEQHAKERQKLEVEIQKIETPNPKLSSELLNKQVQLRHLIKSKKYGAARILKAEIQEMEQIERESWEHKFREMLQKKHDLLLLKQKNEFEAMKTRLEKAINSKLKQRMKAYDKLLHSIENVQHQTMNRQNREFGKVQAVNARVLAKYSLNLGELEQKAMGKPALL